MENKTEHYGREALSARPQTATESLEDRLASLVDAIDENAKNIRHKLDRLMPFAEVVTKAELTDCPPPSAETFTERMQQKLDWLGMINSRLHQLSCNLDTFI